MKFAPRLPKRGTVFRVISIAVIVMFVAFAILAIYVYRQSVGRFEVRRLSLPTRIYADYTPLRAEAAMQRDDLLEKLDRLGYREVQQLAQAGEYIPGKGAVEIFTRQFSHPSGKYEAQPIRVTFSGATIASVASARDGNNVETAALEPELLTSILSDQLENRRPVTLDQVPKHMQDAVVVAEDVRFWHHPGVDPFGIFRALFRNVRSRGVAEGGSTLTQQLVKNYYLTSERTMRRKVVEASMAVVLDAKYSKREILEAYLNDIYLGRNRSISILGVGEASRFYFGKPVSEIGVAEAAMLAGLIPSPNNYSPFVNAQKAKERRDLVLDLMLKHKKIDQAQHAQAKNAKLPKRPFRQRSGLSSIPFYVDRVVQELQRDYGIEDVKGRGLQIYTAIDLTAQDAATTTLEAGLRSLERGNRRLRRRGDKQLQGALIAVDVPTGEIRALVGGRNYDTSQFNRALNARRLVGSLFKPFVYLTAFEPSLSQQNITPATLVSDTRFVLKRRFSENWSPRNYDDKYNGTVTVRTALEQSLNSASVRIGLACGIEPILKTARTLGITTELDDNPAILLGAVGIPPIEMVDAFSTIARQGSRMPLRTIRFVTNDRGRRLATSEVEPVQVFPPRDVYLLTNVMKGVLDRGTGAPARSLGFRKVAAGKTGTTNDKRDAWFIGFTPHTLAVTWIGFDDNSPVGVSGGEGAVPIWARFMNVATAGQKNVDWAPPAGISFVAVDRTSGGLATPMCPPNSVISEGFKAGTEPGNPCPVHGVQVTPPPMVDEFGNPIAIDTAASSTEGMLPPMDVPPPLPPDSTLTGGFPRTETADPTPPPAPTPVPTVDPSPPPPATNTSEPPPATTTTNPPTNT